MVMVMIFNVFIIVLTANQCTFDKDKCGWTNDVQDNDHFDWSRKNGRTASIGTGPSVDHTTGTNQGYYMYIETSYGSVGDQANFLSPVFKQVSQEFKKQCPLDHCCIRICKSN